MIVTGPPGSGKTSIAEGLAERLGLPLIAKDGIKERLADGLGGVAGREESKRLGAATFAVQFHVLEQLLASGCSVLAEGNFGWFEPMPPARVVQVHVSAPPDELRRRLASRQGRHPVHYDHEAKDEIVGRIAAGEWAPLEVGGALIEVDTVGEVDLDALAERVRQAT